MRYFYLCLFAIFSSLALRAQSPTCLTATPICDNISPYPASTDEPDAPFGNNYDCLGTQPNPAWFYFTISQNGSISLPLQNTAVVDVDFVLYGPFPSIGAALNQCGNMGNGGPGGNIVDCSYDPQAFEVIDIANAQAGQVYVLLVTNFSNTPTNIFTLPSSGTGRIACPCRIDTRHTLTPVANNGGQLISTIDSAAQYGVCPGDSLFFTLSMRAGTLLDSLGLDPLRTSINNAFGTSEFALFGPFYPVAGRFDTMQILVGIYPTQATSGVRAFNIGVVSTNRFSRIICPEIAPISVIIPGLSASDTAACSGQSLQLRANSIPATSFGSPNFTWTQIGGPPLNLTPPNSATPTLDIPTQQSTSSANPAVFVVQNTYGTCTLLDTVTVSFPDVSLALDPNPTGTCANANVQITARLSDTLAFSNACLPSYTLTSVPFAPQAASGTSLTLSDDQMTTALPIGFSFRYFCNNYTNFYVSSNGFITFSASQAPTGTNTAIPNNAAPNNMIALAWDDLNPSVGSGTVQYTTLGTAPNRRLVVSFNNIRYYALFGTSNAVTAQLVLYETTNVIEMHITRIDNNNSNMTQGIENAAGNGGLFVQGRNNQSFSSSNEGFRFSPVPGPPIPTAPIYSWSPSNTLSNSTIFNPLASPATNTTYTVTVTDGACRYSGDITVMADAMGVAASVTEPACANPNSGSISLTANGGVAPLTYLWSNGRSSPTLTGIGGGTYSVTVTDANGCTGTTTASLQPAETPTFSTVANNVTCSANGSITLTTSAGEPPFSFAWSNGATTQNVSGLNVGLYQVTVTDNNGCATVSPFIQVANSPGGVAVSIAALSNVRCAGANDGFINVNINNGTAPFNFAWSNGATTQNNSGLGAGTYRLTVTDANGCSATSPNISLISPAPLNLSLVSISNASCNGAATGGITVSRSGGTAPYSFVWSNGAPTQNNPNIPAGLYSLTLTDANGCTATLANLSVSEPSAISISVVSTVQPSCAGGNNGRIVVSAAGGSSGQFRFIWSNTSANTTASNTGLAAGTYSVTAVDAGGCTATLANISLSEPAAATLSVSSITAPTCNGGSDGSISTTIVGGTAPYSYIWSNARTTSNLTGIAAGTYSVSSTDANGCTVSLSNISVSQPVAVSITVVSITAASCNTNNGAIDISATNGVAPYTFVWSNAQTSEDLSALATGTYIVTVTDANGCTATRSINVNNTGTLTATLGSISPVSCFGGSNGAININAAGGAAPVTFLWNTGATTQNLSALSAANNYQLSITDGLGCVSILGTFTVSQPSSLSLTLSSTNVLCAGAATGSITASPAGGTPLYSFAWTGGRTGANLTGLAAGAYAPTLSDANGCTLSLPALSISEPSALTFTLGSSAEPACLGVNDGSITTNASGGTPAYSFRWNTGATTQNLTGLGAGAYSATLTDANGCTLALPALNLTATNIVTLTQTSVTNASCFGLANGALQISTQGGTPAYTFAWSTGATTQNLSGIVAGAYSVTATDADGCTASLSALTLSQPPALLASIVVTNSVIDCDGSATGNLSASASGGSPLYTFAWSNGITTIDNTNLAVGLYGLTVSDANGCTATTAPQIVISPTQPTLAAFIDRIGTTDTLLTLGYSISLNAGANQASTAYSWSGNPAAFAGIVNPNQAQTDALPTAAGDYVYIVTATTTTLGQACTLTDTLFLRVEAINFIGLPTAFTPNGDGENDFFRPVQLDARYIQKFSIFNRWGQLLYDDATLTNGGWDGTYKGVDQPREAYIVILTYQLPQDAQPTTVRGEFTLLR